MIRIRHLLPLALGSLAIAALPFGALAAQTAQASAKAAPRGDATPQLPAAPPAAKKQPHTIQLHGETLSDDYVWLRNKGTPEVEQYLRGELAYAEAFMQPTEALRQKLYDEMLSRIQQTDATVPYRERGYFYYSRTEEGKQYPIFARRKGSPDGAEEVVLDVNRLAEGKKFMAVSDLTVSPDGNLLAYTTDETGFRQYTLQVKDLATGQLRPDTAQRVTSVEWSEDGRTILYSVEHPQTKRSYQVFRHVLGAPKHDLVYEEKDERFTVGVGKSRDRKYLFIDSGSHTTSEVRYLPADAPTAQVKLIAAREPEHEYVVDHRDGTFWIRTNDKGRNFRLVTAPTSDPSRANWKEIVAHRGEVMLAGHLMFKDFYVLFEREGGLPHLRITDFRSGQSRRIEFPEPAYVASPSTNREFDTKLFRFAYESPITSASFYDYDPATSQRTLLKQVAVLGGYDPERYRVELTHATAPDGVKVPMWMVYRKDLMKRDGTNFALLYAYGSYGSSQAATFNPNVFSLVDRGVTYAVAYIRGGGELGKKWHDEGRMMKKKNTFSDFIAAGDHLVSSRVTSKDRLAIMGGSAGGLLMGAVTNMRPDLFKVVVALVPFVDVINTMLDETLPLTVGEFEEWGNPKNAEHYRYMRSYSPYDNVERQSYPTMLVKTSYNDSQVMYWEPAKYVAKLRELKTDKNPLVFHVNMDPAGHGGRSGRYNRLREIAFDYAFILSQLGVEKVAPARPVSASARPTPRTPDGKPDLSGFWQGPLLRNMDKNVPGGFKAIFTAAGAEAYRQNLTKTINPEGLCLFAGIPRASISGVSFQIVQNSSRVVFLYELMWTFRSIPIDGRDRPKDPPPSFFGTGLGKWEGDTLVIDSVAFKDHLSWLDDDAHPHSDAMRVTERWWRPDAEHLAHEVTVVDPTFYTRPFTFDRVFTHMPPGEELIEYACNENNRDLGRLGFGPHDPAIYNVTPPGAKQP